MYKSKILVINGPNLNMLGLRDPEIYGKLSLEDINTALKKLAEANNYLIVFFQSNDEGAIVTEIQKAYTDGTSGVLINAAAYTHTSIAILDALTIRGKMNPLPYVEVHLSDPTERENFRHFSFLRAQAIATISGKQAGSYYEGLSILIKYLNSIRIER